VSPLPRGQAGTVARPRDASLRVFIRDGKLSDVVLEMRDAVPSDHEDFVRLFAELKIPDPPPTLQRFAEQIAPHAFFCVESGRTLAYALWKKYGDTAHVVHVVTAPGQRGRGLGRALMREVAARAQAAGCARWYLNVKEDNAPAVALYERCGMSVAFESVHFDLPWAAIPRLPTGSAATAVAVDAASHPTIEETFALPRGLLASLAAMAGRTLLAMSEPDRVVGFAAFDPDFPGASPFRVAGTEHARPLLEAMRPHARAERTSVHLFVEDDRALAAALRAAGGSSLFRILRMTGELAD
jgi:ribosomal protein S18 acetylase RimI-like enzyme